MRVTIDHERCQGHGRCFSIAPDLFDSDELGNGVVIGDGAVAPGSASTSRRSPSPTARRAPSASRRTRCPTSRSPTSRRTSTTPIPTWVKDPYPIYDDLRERCPVAHSDRYGGTWLPTRHADVAADRERPRALHEPLGPRDRGAPGPRGAARADRRRPADHVGPALPPARPSPPAARVLAEGRRPARGLHPRRCAGRCSTGSATPSASTGRSTTPSTSPSA